MTNVIGPRQPMYFDGRRISDAMFWVPQSGRMGLGFSIFSYDGRVVVGVASDRGLVPDPESIAEAFEAEYRAMRAWVARRGRPTKAPRPVGRPATRGSGARLGAR